MCKATKYLCDIGLLTAMALSAFSCTDEDKIIYIDDFVVADNQNCVIFVCGPDKLGDITYNDEIYRGIIAAANHYDLYPHVEIIGNTEGLTIEDEIDDILWAQNITLEDDDTKTLIVWCNDNYESLLATRAEQLTANPNVTHLLVESKNVTLPIHTMYFSLYGTCYQAGLVVSNAMTDVESVALLSANPADATLAEMRQGFLQGISDGSRSVKTDALFIAQDGGYDMADSAYHLAFELDSLYQMVVPLCGNTTDGLLRYNREFDQSFYTIGIDCDMRKYSDRVPFSMTKSLATAIDEWIGRWAEGQSQDQHIIYDLESGYCGITVSADYKSQLSDAVASTQSAAIEKEQEYLNQK